MELKKACLYARFSSDNQRSESIDAQKRAIYEYVKKHGYVVVEEYCDYAKSGMTDKRPEFQRMILDGKSEKFSFVLVHKFDRFSREKHLTAIYKYELKKRGIRVISVAEDVADNPSGALMEGVLEVMADYYVENLKTEIRKGQLENALKGLHLGGKPPLGFSVDPETKKYLVNSEEAAIVKRIFDLYNKGFSYKKIQQELNADGLRTKFSRLFANNAIYTILRQEKYTGDYAWGKTGGKNNEGHRNRKQRDQSEIIRVEGALPAIISKEQFALTQELLKKNRRLSGTYKAKDLYLLSGIITCGLCGEDHAFHGNSRKSGRGFRYVSYRCSNKAKVKGACGNREISSQILEAFVAAELMRRFFNERSMKQLVKRLDDYQRLTHKEKGEEIVRIRQSLANIKPQIDRLVDALTSGCTYGSVQQKLSELEGQKKAAEGRLTEIEMALANPLIDEKILREILNTYRNYVKTRNYKACKPFFHRYVEKVIVFPERVELVMKLRISDSEDDGLVTANSEIDRNSIQAYRPKATKPEEKAA